MFSAILDEDSDEKRRFFSPQSAKILKATSRVIA